MRLLFSGLCAAVGLCAFLNLNAGPVPAGKPAAYPAWWFERDVIPLLPASAGKLTPVYPHDYPAADDFAVANIGQLKAIAAKARAEFDAKLPSPGAGPEINALINAWLTAPAPGVTRDDFAAINLGQLKTVAKPFYDRLISAGLASAYPWATSTTAADDYALANLGQVKNLFAFEIPAPVVVDPNDTDGNGLLDTWELTHFSHLGVDPNADADTDGLTNLQEYQTGTDPHNADTDGDEIPDAWEVSHSLNPRDPADAAADTDGDGFTNLQEYGAGTDPGYPQRYHRDYVAVQLPTPSGLVSVQATGLNNQGQVVGNAYSADYQTLHAIRWDQLQPTLLPHLSTRAYSWVQAINDQSVAVGYSEVNPSGSYWTYRGVRWPAAGGVQELGIGAISPYSWTTADAINGTGVIAGSQPNRTSGPFRWNNGSYQFINPNLDIPRFASAINDSGSILLTPYAVVSGAQIVTNDNEDEYAYGLNNLGRAVGAYDTWTQLSWPYQIPVYFSADGTRTELPLPETLSNDIYATAINDLGEIVGYSGGNGWQNEVACYWPPDQNHVVTLNDVLPSGSGWNLKEAVGINQSGVIVGSGTLNGADTAFLLLPCALLVDANRDGVIHGFGETDPDITTEERPFRFWANDDIDRRHTFYDSNPDTMGDESEWEEDDIGSDEAAQKGWQEDWKDNVANSLRDLEDFNRIVLSVGGLDEALKNGTLYLGLKWSDTNGATPAIKLYKQYKTSGDLGYLSSDYDAQMQLPEQAIINAKYPGEDPTTTTRTKIDGTETFVLPAALWNGLPAGSIKRPFLFEVCTPGKGQLKLVILKPENGAYTEIGEGPGVWFDFKKIGDMYEQWSVGHGNGGPPDAIAARIPSLTGSGTAFRYDNPTPSPEEKKYILYVHGWNMERWDKERFAETAYKRLWWQGYKGRFGVFTWPATYDFGGSQSDQALARYLSQGGMGVGNGTHFDRGEWTAWRSGLPLRQLLQTLTGAYNGELYVFSHSQGGIVVSEALRLQSQAGGGQIIKIYVPSQAALSAHTYDATLSAEAGSPNALQWTYNHPSIAIPEGIFGPQTPNIYGGWHGSILSGGGGGSKAVGQIKNFYNRNDWALSAPVWQFNQITKPDYSDKLNDQPWDYSYLQNQNYPLGKFQKTQSMPLNVVGLELGTAADVKDRYEIMAFAAESRVKALGATDNVRESAITKSRDLEEEIWGPDPRGQNHRTHRWHSGQFRNYIQYQRSYWEALLDERGFDLPLTPLQ